MLLAAVLIHVLFEEAPRSGSGKVSPLPAVLRTALVACGVLWGVGICGSWLGYAGYAPLGTIVPALYILGALTWCLHAGRGPLVAELASVLSATWGSLLTEGWFLMTAATSLALFVCVGSVDEAAFDALFSIRYPLVLLACAVLCAWSVTHRGEPRLTFSERQTNRVLRYLEGRGMGELQAQVLLDLACGCDVRTVASRRCTTVATVRSYRQRAYDSLGVHSIDDLRELLSRDAGFTPGQQTASP